MSQHKDVEHRKCPKCGRNTMVLWTLAQSGRRRWVCKYVESGRFVYCCSTTNPDVPYKGKGEPEKKQVFNQDIDSDETLIITWAQNATPIHEGFFAALLAYCRKNKARLLVIPGRYKNPTSRWEESQRNAQWWAPCLVPHLVNKRKALNKNLVLLADISTQPTAATPLTGFEGITHGESGILGHPKYEMDTIATPHQRLPKIMTTTGAVTVANYSDTKAGKKGEFHHVLGAVVVERKGSTFHLRNINARKDGAFCDLDKAYFPDGTVKPAGPYLGLVFGDAHAIFADPAVVRATFGKGGLAELLDPEYFVFHDLLDSYAVNPHHNGNPFITYSKSQSGRNDIRREVDETILWLKEQAAGRKAVIVPSNHDNMLRRWINTADWKTDPVNAKFIIETTDYMLDGTYMTANGTVTPDPFHYWVEKAKLPNVNCLPARQSFMIADIECALHGHEGPGGSRGSRKNLSKIGVKTIIGHSHAPGTKDGCYQAGTMTPLELEYTGPVSSWLNSHVSIDPMKKRHHHICIDGEFFKGQNPRKKLTA